MKYGGLAVIVLLMASVTNAANVGALLFAAQGNHGNHLSQQNTGWMQPQNGMATSDVEAQETLEESDEANDKTDKNVGFVTAIAFHASCSQWYSYAANMRLDQTNVLSNFGGAFSGSESAFVCPDFGVYYFQTTVQLQSSANKGQVSITATDGTSYWFTVDGTVGQGAVTQGMFYKCSPGVRVYLERHGNIGGSSLVIWASFFGHRIADA